MLTALELGRQARIAANRAYLAGLQLGPEAMSKGEVRPLQVADPVVLAAARQLATTAALSQAKSQVHPSPLMLPCLVPLIPPDCCLPSPLGLHLQCS